MHTFFWGCPLQINSICFWEHMQRICLEVPSFGRKRSKCNRALLLKSPSLFCTKSKSQASKVHIPGMCCFIFFPSSSFYQLTSSTFFVFCRRCWTVLCLVASVGAPCLEQFPQKAMEEVLNAQHGTSQRLPPHFSLPVFIGKWTLQAHCHVRSNSGRCSDSQGYLTHYAIPTQKAHWNEWVLSAKMLLYVFRRWGVHRDLIPLLNGNRQRSFSAYDLLNGKNKDWEHNPKSCWNGKTSRPVLYPVHICALAQSEAPASPCVS